MHLNTSLYSVKVVLIGTSAGGAGTEYNCDYLAEELKKVNSNIDVKCVADSSTLHPPNTFKQNCRAEEAVFIQLYRELIIHLTEDIPTWVA